MFYVYVKSTKVKDYQKELLWTFPLTEHNTQIWKN